jgi:glutathione S-transferase
MDREDFRALSHRGKVPILDDGGLVVGESGAIVLYLADRYRDGSCQLAVPSDDPEARAAYYDLAFYVLTELDATTLYVLRRHEGLPEVYGEAPAAARAAREYFSRQVGEIERRLDDARPYLLGEELRAPDLLLTTCLDWAAFVGIGLPESVERYRARIAERPAYRQAMSENFAPLAELSK